MSNDKPMLNETLSRDNTLVSVIMPAYNAERFIAEAIESVLAQTHADWELVIVDDGSTDSTVRIIRSYLRPYLYQEGGERIRLVCLPRNTGLPSVVKNHGLRHARGNFIAFLDADDRYEPDALRTLLTHLLENPECIAAHGVDQLIDEQGNPLPADWNCVGTVDAHGRFQPAESYRHTLYQFLTTHCYCQLQSLMLRRETLERVGFFDETLYLAEDKHFFLRLFLDSETRFHFIPKVIFRYRQYPNSVTKNMRRFRDILANVPVMVDAHHALIGNLSGLPGQEGETRFTKAYLAAKEYRWLLAVRLRFGDFRSLPIIIRHAAQNRQLSWMHLLYCIFIEVIYRYAPNLMTVAKRVTVGPKPWSVPFGEPTPLPVPVEQSPAA
jgi:glycosyltransferase involved in cell wall biosynthesis